jgi:aminoglycoside phosphotransferase (APT) family kinase protein
VLLDKYVINVDLGFVNTLVEELETWSEHWRQYITKLQLIKEHGWERIDMVTRRTETGLNVLAHGDLWINNIMFNDQANSMRLVDFQLANHTSPGIDLHLFICSSATLEVQMYHTNTLLQVGVDVCLLYDVFHSRDLVVACFRGRTHAEDEICALLGCYAASNGNPRNS